MGEGGDAPSLGQQAILGRLLQHGRPLGDPTPRYRVDGVLGVGGGGRVFAVDDRNLERVVAMKVISGADEGSGARHLLDEARITASLSHPNVLPVYELDLTDDGEVYYTMKRIEGRALSAALDDGGPLPVNEFVRIFIGIAQALAYAHHHGVVHQDVKPDNIMLGDFGEVLLVDWGSAARLGDPQRRIYGTPLYMSPEQARVETVDERSDVYGLGATMFHALLGRLPTWADQPERFWEKKRRGEIDPPTTGERATAPGELIAITLKALAPLPSDRYASAEALHRDLSSYQAGLAVSAHRDPPWRRFQRWYRSNTPLFWVGMSAVVAIAAALTLYISARLQERPAWTLVSDDRFVGGNLDDIAKRWMVRSTHTDRFPYPPLSDAPLADGSLVSLGADGMVAEATGARVVDIACRSGLSGDLRIEWTCRPLVAPQNLNCFIGGVDRDAGLTVHVGGFGDRRLIVLTRGDSTQLVSAMMPEPLRVGQAYRFTLEHDDRHVRFAVDGRQYIDYVDVDAVVSATLQQFGFDCFPENRIAFAGVTVYRRVPGQRVSPLEVAHRLYQFRHWDEAELQYRGIGDAYPRTRLAADADYRIACCEREIALAGNDERLAAAAASHFERFAAEHPDSELAPLALAERLRIELAAHAPDRAVVSRLREALAAYAGNPTLLQVLVDLGREGAQRLDDVPAQDFTSRHYPPDISDRIDTELATIRRWSAAYRQPLARNPLLERVTKILLDLGQPQRALSLCETDVGRQTCLLHLGRYQDAVALDTGDARASALALLWQGRFDEVVDGNDFPPVLRARAAFLRGDDDQRLRDIDGDSEVVWARRLQQGRYDEYLAAHPTDVHDPGWGATTRSRVLIAAGHPERVLADYRHPSAIAHALIAQGDLEGAMLEDPWDAEVAIEAAVRRLAAGRDAEALAVAERLERAPPRHRFDDSIFDFCLFPAFARAVTGDHAGARALLRSVLEREHDTFGRRCWYIVAYALGEVDERSFLEQPSRALVATRLLLAKGLRFELAGDASAAAEQYRLLLAAPEQCLVQEDLRDFLAWRLRARGMPVPPGISLAMQLDSP